LNQTIGIENTRCVGFRPITLSGDRDGIEAGGRDPVAVVIFIRKRRANDTRAGGRGRLARIEVRSRLLGGLCRWIVDGLEPREITT
jgi:hypothetical protein